jgi:tripartite-type tricarboxylate transporter receptor subunit TctC
MRFPSRRTFTRALSLAAAASLLPIAAAAQASYPAKPVRLVVPFVPGGVSDGSARLVADYLSRRLGQQVVVDNKPGASGNIGTALVAQAEPDGYTLLLAFDGTMVINPHVFDKVPFNTLSEFAPIGKIGDAVLILVSNTAFAPKTLGEVIAASKSTPGGLSYGTSGTGGTPHIAGELLKMRTGANLTHIPYKGGGQAMTDVLGGQIPLVYTAVAGAVGHVKAGKLHPVAVSSRQRAPSLPDVPTFIEAGVPDFEASSWVGLMAPARTPQPILDKLNAALNDVLNDPEAKAKLVVMGITATPGTAQAFGTVLQQDLERYGPVVKAAGIKAQ